MRYRIFVAFFLSFSKGLLDGFGLAMFVPLLKIAGNSTDSEKNDGLGFLNFLPTFFERMGISLNLTNVLAIILVFFVLKGVISLVEGYCNVVFQQDFMRNIRFNNIDSLSGLKYQSFVKMDAGRIHNTFSGEVERVNRALRDYFKALEYGVLIFVYLLLALFVNPVFAVIVAIGGILSNVVFKSLFQKTKKLSKQFTLSAHYFQNLLLQQVSNFKYLKTTGLITLYGRKLKNHIAEFEVYQRKIGLIDSFSRAIREPLTILVVVLAILIQVNYRESTIGAVILSLIFLYRALTFLMAFQDHWNKFLSFSGSLENMEAFTNELKREREQEPGGAGVGALRNAIEFVDVGFKYEKSLILRNINFRIRKNETIAVVGESGSGKTTIMDLLAGVLLPTSGAVIIDGVPTKELNLPAYRKRVGYISQDAPIFNDTIYNNITFWAPKTPENQRKFELAVKKAAIYEYIMHLQKKEEEILGINGINISGGQKQRMSIARELFKDADILIMDEATSALDAETEKLIQNNIDDLKGEYTIVMVAHRLSTVQNADKIILMSHGEIIDEGSFHELLEKSEVFRNMIQLQEIKN